MKLKFKHQKFQEDAAKAVCDVFGGQPYKTFDYQVETRKKDGQTSFEKFTGFRNHPIVPQLTDEIVLKHIRDIQRAQQIKPSEALEGKYNLTIEMETGVGKTYTYIKTIFELNKRYGWCKFIIVVPSVAIREGVHKSLEIMKEHFASDYSTPLSYFIYDSKQLGELNAFVTDSKIHVMIINSQKFNATNKDARRIYMKLDDFGGNCPIDVIAQMNPILIIDEPQSVEGVKTKEGLKRFNPLFTLRYSAAHRELYNVVYRLDAMEAYNLQLVKKIAVKGISISGTTATEGFVYLEGLNLYPDKNPTANIGFEVKRTKAVNQVVRALKINDDLYAKSNHLEEYRNDYVITDINGVEDSVTFRNGIKLYAGDVAGSVNETQLRRIQIRETILSHIEKEQELFEGIVAVIAVVILTWMVFWMRKVSRNVKVQLEQAVDSALQRGNHHGWALVMMVFFAVAREGLESVFFLLAAFQQDVGIWPPLGAMLGLATAVVLGYLIYLGGIRLNLGAFFKWTSLFILLVAAGLAAGAIRAFHEAGLWNHFQDVAFDLSSVLSTHSLFGTLMEGIFGYQEAPSVSEVAVWFIYLIPALIMFALPPRSGTTASRTAP